MNTKRKSDMTKNDQESFKLKLVKFRNYQGEDQILTYAEIEDEISQHKDRYKILLTYFPGLDHVDSMSGVEPGELIVISGPRKSGKTLLAQTLTQNFWRQGIHSLWFSYELTYRQFGYSFKKVETPVMLMPKKLKAYALEWVEDRIAEAVAKHGIQIVFIDHLHFLFDIAQARKPDIQIGQIMRYLKRIAIDGNVVIFLMCHFKKSGFDKEPDDSSFRDSSFIAQESDVGLILWRVRKKTTPNDAVLKVCYSRRTGAFERKISLCKDFLTGMLVEKPKEEGGMI
ncbi:hypothetical protein LCGC14_2124350 [marine sediment metagenome]|uniref:SF4 helicase domain-containing protein n=1 Tax=marine sediment metagenome TaxID=412755 RepID=A0A0F9E393_9ZZZZ